MLPKFKLFVPLAAVIMFLFAPRAAHAEDQDFVFYLTSSNLRVTNVVAGQTLTSTATQQLYGNFWVAGFGGGVTFNYEANNHLLVGLDIHAMVRPGNPGASTVMPGVRLGFHAKKVPIKPFAQVSFGLLNTTNVNLAPSSTGTTLTTDTGSTFANHYFAYEVMGGLDIKVSRLIDIRAIEIGGGQTIIDGSVAGASHASLLSIDSGIVFKF